MTAALPTASPHRVDASDDRRERGHPTDAFPGVVLEIVGHLVRERQCGRRQNDQRRNERRKDAEAELATQCEERRHESDRSKDKDRVH